MKLLLSVCIVANHDLFIIVRARDVGSISNRYEFKTVIQAARFGRVVVRLHQQNAPRIQFAIHGGKAFLLCILECVCVVVDEGRSFGPAIRRVKKYKISLVCRMQGAFIIAVAYRDVG